MRLVASPLNAYIGPLFWVTRTSGPDAAIHVSVHDRAWDFARWGHDPFVKQEFFLGAPCTVHLLAILCTVFLTALTTRISTPSGASVLTCLQIPQLLGVATPVV